MRLNRRGNGSSTAGSFIICMLVALLGLLRLDAGSAKTGAAGVSITHPDGAVLSSGVSPQKANIEYGHLPLVFELNQGQTDPQVKFLARGSGYGLFLTSHETVLELQSGGRKDNSVVRMQLAGANQDAVISATDQLPGKSNYFLGNDPAKWHSNVPQFARVHYSNVYKGINLVYYGVQGRMEFDFEVAPGADPRQIALHFAGPRKLKVTPDGELVLASAHGDLRFHSPKIYQQIGSERIPVAGRFSLRGRHEAGFDLAAYDPRQTLIIDPVLSYSTYLGGNGAESCSAISGIAVPPGPGTPGCPAIAVDSASRVYMAGTTTSTVFPNPTASPSLRGTANVFLAQLDSSGSALIYSTYLGGSGKDVPAGVAVDSGFNVYVAGTTTSTDFPVSAGAFQASALSAGPHVFVSKLNSTASAVLYSTYLSGNGADNATGLAVDPGGRAYVTGTTTSPAFPTSGGFPVTTGTFQSAPKAVNQFFLSRLDPGQTGAASLLYSTYIGGSTPSNGVTIGGGIAVDTNSSAYITGGTNFTDMPVLNASQGTNNGGVDAFVGEFLFPSNGTQPTRNYLTYFGGSGDEAGYAIAVDASFSAYITGSTTSTNVTVPTGTTAFQAANGGGIDAFVAKFGNLTLTTTSPTGTVPLNYFSFLGGSGTDIGLGIAVDTIGGARVTGWTNSGNFPTLNVPSGLGASGLPDAFAARIETTATSATTAGNYSTYIGGNGSDVGTSVAVDSTGASYVAGETSSSNFPVLTPFQGSLNGPSDAFVTRLGPLVNLSMTATATPSPVGVGNQVTFTYTIINHGDFVSGVTFTDVLPPATSAVFVSATASPGQCGQTAGTVTCTLGALNTTASSTTTSATVTLVLTAAAPTQTTQGTTPSQPPPLGNSARLTVPGSSFQTSASAASVTVNDFGVAVTPATTTVPAGVPAQYTVTVTPTGAGFPETVSLACSGLPTGATCNFTNNPIPNLSSGAQSRSLVINTTARVTTTADLLPGKGPFHAWLPISGIALLGAGFGRNASSSRKRFSKMVFLLGFLAALIIFQAGCGGSKKKTTTTTGTPAGSYTITVAGTSGTATRNAVLQLVVQ
ncbi:MAG: SBBP repeat-containing protein [Acidobacteriota bacterium]|nr:SBBP repeat-containing protein [Acidobacteriota bacterium]